MAQIDKYDTMSAMREISEFSCLDVFGHLFDLRPWLRSALRKVEEHCQLLTHSGLILHLPIQGHGVTDQDVEKSKLEQVLASLFSARSPFWETYYARLAHTQGIDCDMAGASPERVLQVSRTCYPYFFVVPDALHHLTSRYPTEYAFIQISLQFLLQGLLLKAMGQPDQGKGSILKALQIVGPLDVPAYRAFLIQGVRWERTSE